MFPLYTCILIIGFISGVCMETCPEAEDIYPCSCKEDVSREITVTCTSGLFLPLHHLKSLQQSLSKFTGKKDVLLRLEGFNISMPSNFFSGIGIKILEFHSCRIHSFTNDDQPAFLGLENHLEVRNLF